MTKMSHTQRFQALTEYLQRFHSLWSESPFYGVPLGWQTQYPSLSDALLHISDQELHALDSCTTTLHSFIARYLPDFKALETYLHLPACASEVVTDKFASLDVPGRKWQQITAFLEALPPSVLHASCDEIFDWCAGKSHLGRLAASVTHKRLHAVERDASLCDAGKHLASQASVRAHFQCADVLRDPLRFGRHQQVFALHACGDLHRQLVRLWNESEAKILAFAPCCYDKWLKQDYVPLSSTAQHNNLHLTRTQVRLAMQEAVTASAREQHMMHELKILRLGFDRLQREIRGLDEYLPTPSLPLSATKWGTQKVFAVLAERKGLALPTGLNLDVYVNEARRNYGRIRRLQLAGHGFRRALELWMITDLALYLEQSGSDVRLQEFCPRRLSPRNIQVIATR